jgi:hypothetical protein
MRKNTTCVPKKGDWVLLINDDVVACDKNAKKIMKIANQYTDSEVVISKVPSSSHCYY